MKRFLLRVLLWLPLCFALWYYAGMLLVLPVTWLVNTLLPALFPAVVAAVEQQGHLLDVVTRLTLAEAGIESPGGRPGLVVFTVNPLAYGFGLPLFAGLALACPGEHWDRRILVALLVLVPVQAFGAVTAALKTLAFELGPVAADRLGIQGWEFEMLALAYQFGYLILPAVTPVVLWLILYRDFVAELVPQVSGYRARE